MTSDAACDNVSTVSQRQSAMNMDIDDVRPRAMSIDGQIDVGDQKTALISAVHRS